MYIKYNTVLRSKTKDPAMVKLARDLTRGNGYPTSIHAINSCVVRERLTLSRRLGRP